ncbi:unnamed protein product [Caenorhabditis auriculariae]|uniref:Saposin B-type domain-containing protein n=1 Tax=Caenorhabditis auriculariae TaxID=2777116 RepID=A0A8S1H483_9PELO|nr:unnamed protein product [Caenorhabditis auriculariae]
MNATMRLECLLVALLAGTTTQIFCEPIEYFDPFPNCNECARVVGDTRVGIENVINGFNTAIHVFCHLQRSEEQCMATKELIMKTMEQTKDSFFPMQYEKNVSRVVACAHGFKICPDLSKDGKPLKIQQWSCQACSSFFNALFKLLRSPINDVNTLAPGFFCQERDESCINAFKDAIQLGGSLGDIFKDQKITANVCRNILKCIE